jgi:hypothetical protein
MWVPARGLRGPPAALQFRRLRFRADECRAAVTRLTHSRDCSGVNQPKGRTARTRCSHRWPWRPGCRAGGCTGSRSRQRRWHGSSNRTCRCTSPRSIRTSRCGTGRPPRRRRWSAPGASPWTTASATSTPATSMTRQGTAPAVTAAARLGSSGTGARRARGGPPATAPARTATRPAGVLAARQERRDPGGCRYGS